MSVEIAAMRFCLRWLVLHKLLLIPQQQFGWLETHSSV